LEVFPKTKTLDLVPNAAGILYVLGVIVSLLMWGFGLVWLFLALAMVVQSKGFPFSMGWWSFTFPIGLLPLRNNHSESG
jgi:tellurite resistance protein TehA-like permease